MFSCSILPVREWRYQDVHHVLLYEIILFSVYSAALNTLLGKNASIQSKLPTAACSSREEKRRNCEANLLYVKSDFGTTDKSFTVFFARQGVKFDRRVKISARSVK